MSNGNESTAETFGTSTEETEIPYTGQLYPQEYIDELSMVLAASINTIDNIKNANPELKKENIELKKENVKLCNQLHNLIVESKKPTQENIMHIKNIKNLSKELFDYKIYVFELQIDLKKYNLNDTDAKKRFADIGKTAEYSMKKINEANDIQYVSDE